MDIGVRLCELRAMVDQLCAGKSVQLPDVDNLEHLTSLLHRERFYEAIGSTWLYYYLPLGHVFGGRSPNVSSGEWEKPSPLAIEKKGSQPNVYFEVSLKPDFKCIHLEVTPECITLAEILTEIWYLANFAVVGLNEAREKQKLKRAHNLHLRLSAFRHPENISQKNPNVVSVDILCASYFTAECSIKTEDGSPLWRFDVNRQPKNTFGCAAPEKEFNGGKFAYNNDQLTDCDLISLACFPAFYSDSRCFGTVLISKDGNTFLLNGAPPATHVKVHDVTRLPQVLDALQNGTWPAANSVHKSGTFGFDFKLLIMFGTNVDSSSDLMASTAFFSLGLRCDEETAIAIAEKISAGINMLQTKLLRPTTQFALRKLHETKADLEKKNTDLEKIAAKLRESQEELERKQLILDTVLPQVMEINESIARLQTQVQYVNGHLAPGQSGLFSAYSKVAPLFNDGSKVTLVTSANETIFSILIDHSAEYGDRSYDCALLLCLALGYFLGYDPLEVLKKEPALTKDNWHTEVEEKLKFYCEEVIARAKQKIPTAIAIIKLCLPTEHLLPFTSLSGLQQKDWESAYKQFFELISTDRNLALKNIKKRYHKPLKTGKRTKMSLELMLPYVEVRSKTTDVSCSLWESWIFSSPAPLLQFLEHFLLTESAKSKSTCWYEIHHCTDNGFAVNTLTIKNNNKAKEPALFAGKVDWEGARAGIYQELKYLQEGGLGNSITGYSTGDTVIPFQRLLHLVPRNLLEMVTPTEDKDGVTLSFAEKNLEDTRLILKVMGNCLVIKSSIFDQATGGFA